MVERSLCMREVQGSMPCFSKILFIIEYIIMIRNNFRIFFNEMKKVKIENINIEWYKDELFSFI